MLDPVHMAAQRKDPRELALDLLAAKPEGFWTRGSLARELWRQAPMEFGEWTKDGRWDPGDVKKARALVSGLIRDELVGVHYRNDKRKRRLHLLPKSGRAHARARSETTTSAQPATRKVRVLTW